MIFNPTTRARRILAAALAAGTVGAAGVGAAANAHASPPTGSGGAARVAAVSTTTSTVPASLTRAETAAEDVIGYLEKGQPAKSRAEARVLHSLAHGRAADELRRAGVTSAAVRTFQKRADRVAALSAQRASALRISQAANDVSQLMPAFYGRFSDPVPPAVLALDHLDRQVQLDARAGDRAALRATVAKLAKTWRGLRPSLVQHGGAAIAKRYDAHVAALRHDGRSATIQHQATIGLDLVDQMETVFLGK